MADSRGYLAGDVAEGLDQDLDVAVVRTGDGAVLGECDRGLSYWSLLSTQLKWWLPRIKWWGCCGLFAKSYEHRQRTGKSEVRRHVAKRMPVADKPRHRGKLRSPTTR